MILRRPAFWVQSLAIIALLTSAVTPATEWVQLTPRGQWKRTPSPETGSSDVRAVRVSGSYAYLADLNDDLQVIDIRNPSNPQRVGGYDTGGIVWNLTITGNLVLLADLRAGLVVIDVTRPTDPQRLGVYPTAALGVAVQGNYAYVACGTNGLHVLDITDPTSPKRVGVCGVPGEAYEVAVLADHAYVADFKEGLLVVIDIRNARVPQVIATYKSGLYPTDIAVVGGEAYVAAGTSGLLIWDVRNPANAKLVGSWQEDCIVGRLAVSGSNVYLTGGVCGWDTVSSTVRVIDVHQPAHPMRVGGRGSIGSRGLTRSGDYLYVAAGHEGLQVIEVTELPALTSQLVANGNLILSWNQAGRGLTLQRASSFPQPLWEDVPNSEATNGMVLPLLSGSEFYRLRSKTPRLTRLPQPFGSETNRTSSAVGSRR